MAALHSSISPEFSNDTAFEPHAGYMFEESTNMDQMRRDIESYDSNHSPNSGHLEESAMADWGAYTGMPSNDPGESFQMPGFAIEYGTISPITPSWQAPTSFMPRPHMVAMGNRDNGVTQHFGQVTPGTTHSHSPVSVPDDLQNRQPLQSQQTVQSNAKSERARNAANHRHSQSKQARDMLRKGRKGSAGRGDAEDEEKPRAADKQEYREKNRQAAAKCRKKKKDSTEILETTARSAAEENNRLRNMVRELRDEFSDLRTKALAHDATGGCRCSGVHDYNAKQAMQEATRGHVGSPTMGTHDMQVQAYQAFQAMQSMQSPIEGSMSTPELPAVSLGSGSSRTQSFSNEVRPGTALQQPRHIRADSKQDSILQQALQLDGNEFDFDLRLEGIQEEGNVGGFQ